MMHIDYKRRQFLQYATLGTIAASLPGLAWAESPTVNATPNEAFKADVEIAFMLVDNLFGINQSAIFR